MVTGRLHGAVETKQAKSGIIVSYFQIKDQSEP
jgi:hypothetical protein